MMNLEIYGWTELPAYKQEMVADLVETYTHGELGETPQMLSVTKQGVYTKYMGAVALTDDLFCGYIAASKLTSCETSDMIEVGSLWVPLEFRKQGIAHELVKYISANIVQMDKVPFAFCNSLSVDVFLDSGYKKTTPEDIPVEAFGLCAKCPAKPRTGCCDTIVMYKGEEQW